MARVLVACEFTGIVRQAFAVRGHDVWSCNLLPSEQPGQHIQGDVLAVLGEGWDIMLAFPPCTHLATSGARWFARKRPQQEAALDFVRQLLEAPIPRICLENPLGVISSRIRPADQLIEPWEYGHQEMKRTCLWLKNLPYLQPTCLVWPREQKVWHNTKGERRRGQDRSRSYPGIALAMSTQWG